MATPHNTAQPGQIAKTCLMPGDPLRAKLIAERYLENPQCFNSVRGMLGYTGTWNGHRITIQGSGMGMASLSIYANELIRDYGAKTLIRIGSAGAMQPHVRIRDVVVAMSATTISTASRGFFREVNFAPTADFGLLRAAAEKAEGKGMRFHAGNMLSSDIFYHADGFAGYGALPAHGVIGVEMEAAALYTLAARFDIRALTICTMTDCLITKDEISADERQTSLKDMMAVALDVAVGL